jgi:hypothetical protein
VSYYKTIHSCKLKKSVTRCSIVIAGTYVSDTLVRSLHILVAHTCHSPEEIVCVKSRSRLSATRVRHGGAKLRTTHEMSQRHAARTGPNAAGPGMYWRCLGMLTRSQPRSTHTSPSERSHKSVRRVVTHSARRVWRRRRRRRAQRSAPRTCRSGLRCVWRLVMHAKGSRARTSTPTQHECRHADAREPRMPSLGVALRKTSSTHQA